MVINEDGLVRGCNLLPSNEFSEYSLEQYIEDVHNGVEKNYEADLENIRHHMEERGLTLEDMKCTGFCRIESYLKIIRRRKKICGVTWQGTRQGLSCLSFF